MACPTQPAAFLVLRRRWRQWNAVVDLFASRRFGRHGVDPKAYLALYRDLLRACRAVEAEVDGADRECCRQLQEIVRPWLNIQAFARADNLVLLSLADSCQSAGRWMEARREPARLLRWCLLAVAALILTAALVLAETAVHEPIWELWYELRSWVASLRAFIESLSDVQMVFLVVLVVIWFSLLFVSRTRASG